MTPDKKIQAKLSEILNTVIHSHREDIGMSVVNTDHLQSALKALLAENKRYREALELAKLALLCAGHRSGDLEDLTMLKVDQALNPSEEV